MRGDDHGTSPVRLGAYAARSCAVRAQWDVVRPCEPAPDTPFRAGLARDGIAFEADVVADLAAREPDAVVIDPSLPTAEREARTLAALAAGAPLVIGPRLPHDPESGRVGAPDLLVRRDGAYAPVDVKNHRTDEDGTYDSARGDLLQLAHYHRMLETLGHAATAATAAPATAIGAIIGNDRREVWFDLDAPRFTAASPAAAPDARVSALDLYDAEYAERVRVARAAAAHVADPAAPLARMPVWFGECPGCRWREHCGTLLAERQDVSLLPGVGLADHEALARVGADTMPALAALPDGTRVDGIGDGGLAAAVAQARARLSPDVAHRRPGIAHVTVERADVELDVDMENVADGAYLWGVHVTDRTGDAATSGLATPGYHAFVDWDADAGVAGARAFAAFWAWLSELRAACDARGLTLRAYCWHETAENGWLRRGAEATGVDADDVERFIGSEQWVDLLKVFRRQVITGYGNGLKVVAPLLGFAWADEDPSGGSSMLWWRDAVDADATPAAQEAARTRLLAYNADDVRATLHVREWLTREGPTLREVPRGAVRR